MWKLSLKEAPEVTQGDTPRTWVWVRTTQDVGLDLTPNSSCFHDVRRRRGREDDVNAARRAPVTLEKQNLKLEPGGTSSFSETMGLTYSLGTLAHI